MSYHRPSNLPEALTLCARPDMRIIAGGTDVFPASPGRDLRGEVLDLMAISTLSGVTETDFGWRIGAITSWSDVIQADLPLAFDALKQAASEVGSVQIQNAGTVGGNLCNASPAADGVPPLLTLDAMAEIASLNETRQMPLSDFLKGVRKTALRTGEILSAILIPKASCSGRSVFSKLGSRKYLVISTAMVAVQLEMSVGKITRAAVAVGACSPVAQRLPGFEAALIGMSPDNPDTWQTALQSDIKKHLNPIDDIRADADYRATAVAELIKRSIVKAAS
jgi:CO/xanthine dehydrogenase FAD-binding subunit